MLIIDSNRFVCYFVCISISYQQVARYLFRIHMDLILAAIFTFELSIQFLIRYVHKNTKFTKKNSILEKRRQKKCLRSKIPLNISSRFSANQRHQDGEFQQNFDFVLNKQKKKFSFSIASHRNEFHVNVICARVH